MTSRNEAMTGGKLPSIDFRGDNSRKMAKTLILEVSALTFPAVPDQAGFKGCFFLNPFSPGGFNVCSASALLSGRF